METSNWQDAFKALKNNYNFTDDSIGVFAANLRFNLDDIQTVANESITGGGDDKKCDILYVDKERQIAIIAQCYVALNPNKTAPSNKASDLNTAIGWLLSANIDNLPDTLKGRADELRSAIENGEIKQIYIWYVHNCLSSKNVQNELTTVENTARSALKRFSSGQDINVFAEEVGDQELNRLYMQAERTVIVTDTIETSVFDAIEIEGKNWSSIITTVKGSWLHELYQRHKTNLFSANLRGYLGSRQSDSNINNGIKSSAQNDPDNFYVYNNGVTALVLDYELGPRGRGHRKLKINGISIVNGAQTTGSLASLDRPPTEELRVGIRFIKAKKEELVSNVVRFNNSQNKLQAADFKSTDPIQERLRSEFSLIPDAEYEGGRRGGASDAIRRSKFTLPSYTVGQALAAFHGDPVTAYDKKSELWTNEKNYRHIFTERTTAKHIVFCYSLLTSINEHKIDLIGRQKRDPSSLTHIENSQLEFLYKKGANYLLAHIISQSMETVLSRPIPNRFDLHFKSNISPAEATKNWSPLVKMILSLSNQLEGAFTRNRITNEGVLRTAPNFVGVIASLSNIQEEMFNSFNSKVAL